MGPCDLRYQFLIERKSGRKHVGYGIGEVQREVGLHLGMLMTSTKGKGNGGYIEEPSAAKERPAIKPLVTHCRYHRLAG